MRESFPDIRRHQLPIGVKDFGQYWQQQRHTSYRTQLSITIIEGIMSSYISKASLAMQYFEDYPVEVAVKNLSRELRNTPDLMKAHEATGYRHTSRRFTPKQAAIIRRYLGEP